MKTRNRKPLRGPPIFEATWEIRFGPENRFYVLFDVDRTRHMMSVIAIGEKRGQRLLIAGEEMNP